jgi:predicted DNA-binding protein with PD1-like motif
VLVRHALAPKAEAEVVGGMVAEVVVGMVAEVVVGLVEEVEGADTKIPVSYELRPL